MLGMGIPIPPETASTGYADPLIAVLLAAIVVTALIAWSVRTSRTGAERFEREVERSYDEAA